MYNITSSIACENTKLDIECDSNTVIHILASNYGRIKGQSCQTDPPDYDANVECHEKYAFRVIRDKCEGVRKCSIDVKSEQFSLDGDPSCSDVPHKYLKVIYGCVTRKGNIYVFSQFEDKWGNIKRIFYWSINGKLIILSDSLKGCIEHDKEE